MQFVSLDNIEALIYAYMYVLAIASEYFDILFRSNWIDLGHLIQTSNRSEIIVLPLFLQEFYLKKN